MTMITNHAAVKAILDLPNSVGRYDRWWTRVFGQGIELSISHRAGKYNVTADVSSRSPHGKPPTMGIGQDEILVAVVRSSAKNVSLLGEEPHNEPMSSELPTEQRKDPFLWALIDYLQNGELPRVTKQSQIIAAKASTYCTINYVLYFINSKKRRCGLTVVPRQLRKRMIEEYHGGPLDGHYSGNCLYNTLSNNWY